MLQAWFYKHPVKNPVLEKIVVVLVIVPAVIYAIFANPVRRWLSG